MLRRKFEQRWFYPHDFMKDDLGALFVGYEASARFSEMARMFPKAIESIRDGKYFKRRLCWEIGDKKLYYIFSEDLRRHFILEKIIK